MVGVRPDPGSRRAAGSATVPDHVLGASASSTTLAELTVREPVERALDLGTGSGIQSLHLSTHARRVVATDVNPRCLRLAALTAALNGVDLDLRLGSLYEPVQDGSFGLVVANLPFVVSPGTGQRLVYRDSGLPGDEIVRRVVTDSVAHLDHGGSVPGDRQLGAPVGAGLDRAGRPGGWSRPVATPGPSSER